MFAELILAQIGSVAEDCTWNGIPLYGEVQIVESFPDVRVQIVSSFPDIKVKQVTSFPDHCGEWEYVSSFADFTIQFVDSFPDVRIKYVRVSPACPRLGHELYHEHILPHVIGFACGQPQIMKKRSQIVPLATGRVLEVGFGAGPNLSFYDPAKVSHLYALEPSEGMRRKAADAIAACPVTVELIDLPGEEIPLEDASVDTVVLTYTLCTIPDAEAALAQMRRVLKPGGKLLFSEHGGAPDANVAKWQRRIEPVWKPMAGGCHLTRHPDAMMQAAGFGIEQLEAMYLPKSPKFASFNYAGIAVKA